MIHEHASKQGKGIVTSGEHHSYWIDSVNPIHYTPLNTDIETDVAIVGGGIAGLTIAYSFAKAGWRVSVLEDGYLGSGETGRTTAHIVNALDDRYFELIKKLGKNEARLAAESHTAAIDFVERVVAEEKIDCDFLRVPGYLFLHPNDDQKTLDDELEATHACGIATTMLDKVPGVNHSESKALKFPAQAQFHPMKYLRGLAEAICKMGGKIYTETKVTDFGKEKISANGHEVKSKFTVVSTNTPINDLVTMHTKQHPYRTYVVAGLIPKGTMEYALWWDTGDIESPWTTDPYHYVRLQPYNDQFDLLIAGGEDHKTGQSDKEEINEEQRFDKLITWARTHFPQMQDIEYKWSGQVMEPVDSLAFIGRNPGDEHVYIVTGDSGNGMTHGTIAGILIPDLIQGRENAWEKIYSPSRITLKAAGTFLKEVGNMTVQYLDYLAPSDIESLQSLKPNEGAIMSFGVKKVAVFRDEQNVVHAHTAVCPHLGCVVQWNGAEKSFDCPCHGSRFTCYGKVVNGPALSDLKKIVLKS